MPDETRAFRIRVRLLRSIFIAESQLASFNSRRQSRVIRDKLICKPPGLIRRVRANTVQAAGWTTCSRRDIIILCARPSRSLPAGTLPTDRAKRPLDADHPSVEHQTVNPGVQNCEPARPVPRDRKGIEKWRVGSGPALVFIPAVMSSLVIEIGAAMLEI